MNAASRPYQVMPPPSAEDYAALEASIVEHGVLQPVEYDEDGAILDGHTRVAICEGLGLVDWPKIIRKGLSEPEKRAHAREVNVARRHLTREQKSGLVADQLRDTPSLADRAIAAMLSVDHKTVGRVREELASTGEIPQLEAREGRDGRRRRAIRTQYVPDRENVREFFRGAKELRSAEQAHNRTVRLDLMREMAARTPADPDANGLPRGRFPVGYVDCPWKNHVYGEETGNDRAYPYPPMTEAEIFGLCAGDRSPFTADAVLFYWTTANRVAIAVDGIRAWGFDYKSQIVWDKVWQGTGRWVFDRHEVLMIATRGDFPAPLPGTQPQSVHREPKTAHSRKPAWFAETIQALYPGVPKLEMFQRASSLAADDVRLNGEWEFWGNEAGLPEAAE